MKKKKTLLYRSLEIHNLLEVRREELKEITKPYKANSTKTNTADRPI
jgi:hypothetical protein